MGGVEGLSGNNRYNRSLTVAAPMLSEPRPLGSGIGMTTRPTKVRRHK